MKALRARIAVLEKRAAGAQATTKEAVALRRKIADLEDAARTKAAGAQATREALAPDAFPPIEAYKTAAKAIMAQKAPADISPTRYLYARMKYANEAFQAVRRGATKQAFDAKNKELLNHYLFREAAAARDYLDKFESEVARTLRPAAQQKLGLADAAVEKRGEVGDYRDQHNWLLARYGLSAPM